MLRREIMLILNLYRPIGTSAIRIEYTSAESRVRYDNMLPGTALQEFNNDNDHSSRNIFQSDYRRPSVRPTRFLRTRVVAGIRSRKECR